MNLLPIVKKFVSSLILLIFLFALPSISFAVCQVTLKWDANNPAPEGYRLFVREQGQNNYGNPSWEGNTTTATITGLKEGKTYYTVAKAYKGELESNNSNEVYYTFKDDCEIINTNFPWMLVIPAIGEKKQ